MDKVIEVRNLVKVYGRRSAAFTALKGINLDIYRGESVAIVGKSGSGKSTLMHLLALLDRPTEGTIRIECSESTQMSARKLNRLRNQSFGFVFQQFFMNPNDSVLENVMLPLKIAGVRRRERKIRAARALQTVGLGNRLKFKANDLSGGQKQRLCIARAIINDPAIIFADEPTGNLDSATGEKIIDLLFDFNLKKGATLIIVTHDEDLAKLCSRQIRISDGRIIEDTGYRIPDELLKNRVIGAMKLTEPTEHQRSRKRKTTVKRAKTTKKSAKTADAIQLPPPPTPPEYIMQVPPEEEF